MILAYRFRQFKEAILNGQKIHTIREDKTKRWKVGMSIQHWMGSPRNKRTNPHEFKTGTCMGIQEVIIDNFGDGNFAIRVMDENGEWKVLRKIEENTLIKNDGLTRDEFIKFFVPNDGDTFRGRIIHFTNLKYL